MILYDEITVYKTADGKTFEDEDEARDYAIIKEMEAFGDNLKCYDSNMKLIPPNRRFIYCVDGIYYLNIKSNDACEWICDFLSDYCGIISEGITTAGIYHYDDNINMWVNIDKKIKDLQKLQEQIERGN